MNVLGLYREFSRDNKKEGKSNLPEGFSRASGGVFGLFFF